jgi:hypothetical protein
MVGGAIRSKLIHRMSYRASVLHQLWTKRGEKKHCTGDLCLDNAFALIEGHPQVLLLVGAASECKSKVEEFVGADYEG